MSERVELKSFGKEKKEIRKLKENYDLLSFKYHKRFFVLEMYLQSKGKLYNQKNLDEISHMNQKNIIITLTPFDPILCSYEWL